MARGRAGRKKRIVWIGNGGSIEKMEPRTFGMPGARRVVYADVLVLGTGYANVSALVQAC